MTKRREARPGRLTGPIDPAESARAASLRYVRDDLPGIARRRSGRGFAYLEPEGKRLNDPSTLARIRALAIPPAWTRVWICPFPTGHLQATGRDARGRKQYRYHNRWRKVRDENKYDRMILFGNTLSRIRARVRADLELTGLPREKLLALVVRLLEMTLIRIGNEEYARTNESFGLTTLRGRHVQVDGANIHFRFQGKSGKAHAIRLTDRRLARLVQRCRELPGQDLFQYLDESGQAQPIDSADVNDYLRAISGEDFTAKDFRTWAGTLIAARHLGDSRDSEQNSTGKSAVVRAAELVARELGNTAAICRKCYIHPAVLGAYEDRALFDLWTNASARNSSGPELAGEESVLLRFLATIPGT